MARCHVGFAVTLFGDAFTEAKIEFFALPVTSKKCVEQYMLGCKILAQYAKAELSASGQVHREIFWKGLEKLHLRRDTTPKRTAAWAITALGLKTPSKDARTAEDFPTRQDPSWSVLLEKLRTGAGPYNHHDGDYALQHYRCSRCEFGPDRVR